MRAAAFAVRASSRATSDEGWRCIRWGLGVGLTSAIGPAYISEIAPAARRGFFTSFQQMAIALGIIASLVVNDIYVALSGGAEMPLWMGIDAWRWMLVTTALPGMAMFFLCFALPETPRYLVMKGEVVKAKEVLVDVIGDDDADATIARIRQSFISDADERKVSFSELRGKTFGLKSVVWIAIIFVLLAQANGQNIIMLYDSSLWNMLGFSEQASLTIAVVRATLAAVATAANWLFNFLITTIYPPMRDGIGLGWTYGFYTVMALLGFFFVVKFLPETNGVELEDMKAEL